MSYRASVDGDDLLLPWLYLDLLGDLAGVVGRAAISDHDHRPQILVVLEKAMANHLDHMFDGSLIIVTGNPRYEIRN